MKILFTCMGTSDPVRGYHDGPMLHIMRFYRPEKICVFLSDEATKLNENDGRIKAVAEFVKNKWKYSPEIEVIKTEIKDPSDLDLVSEPMTKAVKKLSEKYKDSEILLNLSSGTPQMKIVMATLSTDMRYKTVGIQVKNYEKASGTSERTNKPSYSTDLELECNEDEEPDAENRCTVPELLHLQRQQAREQIFTLLDRRNYSAIYAMKDKMPDDLKALVGHLEARDKLQSETAKNRAKNLKLPFTLYPIKNTGRYSDYSEISEYYLALRNRQHTGQYEETVLRLNPLVIRLELRTIERSLTQMGLKLTDIFEKRQKNKSISFILLPERMQQLMPDIYQKACQSFGRVLENKVASIEACWHIINSLSDVDADTVSLFEKCCRLNKELRNDAAHQLTAVTENQIYDTCGLYPAQLMNCIGDLVTRLYPECDRSLFDIYKRCGEYIKENLL